MVNILSLIDTINDIDTSLFLYINSGHNNWLDPIMLQLSYNYYLMLSLFLFLSFLGFKYFKKQYFIMAIFIIISFALSDSISTRLFKKNFKRLRPCHQEQLKSISYLAGKKCGGGKYGFLSSHASNSFAISMFFWMLFRKKSKIFSVLFFYSFMVSYSRVYLARHFPMDVICGAILGLSISYLLFVFYKKFVINNSQVLKQL